MALPSTCCLVGVGEYWLSDHLHDSEPFHIGIMEEWCSGILVYCYIGEILGIGEAGWGGWWSGWVRVHPLLWSSYQLKVRSPFLFKSMIYQKQEILFFARELKHEVCLAFFCWSLVGGLTRWSVRCVSVHHHFGHHWRWTKEFKDSRPKSAFVVSHRSKSVMNGRFSFWLCASAQIYIFREIVSRNPKVRFPNCQQKQVGIPCNVPSNVTSKTGSAQQIIV